MNAHSSICRHSCDQCPTLLEVANGHPVGVTGETKNQRFRGCSFFRRSRSCAVSQGVLSRRASVVAARVRHPPHRQISLEKRQGH
jgi:hypothetical protein